MATVLVVDDTPVERRRAGALLEKGTSPGDGANGTGLHVTYAANGREALESIRTSAPDLVVTDLQMPEMTGLDLVREVRASYPEVPVVLMTAHGSEEIAAQALQIGAAGYVPKRTLAKQLRETVDNILNLNQSVREQQHVLDHLIGSEFHFRLPNDPALISPLVGFLQGNLRRLGLCDDAGTLRVTIALREALINAFTHGNLQLPSHLRETDPEGYRQMLRERLEHPVYRDRRVHVLARESSVEVAYVVRDEGPGFDPADLPDPTDPANLEKATGRGLFLIRAFMDEVRHNPEGNELTLVKRRDA